jgi:hypothetical protein
MSISTRVGVAVLTAFVSSGAPLHGQVETPAPCPEGVDPGWIGYPANIIPFDDGDDSGRFLVFMLTDPNALTHGPRASVSYVTVPSTPWDIDNIHKEWRSAAIDCDCFWLTIWPQQWWVVQERWKYGTVETSDGEQDCDDPTQLTDVAYDPYGEPSGSTDCAGQGGTGTGSGIQFQPGDYTGGETVDWRTGVGNGGSSACGASAVVEWVCIDVWNPEKRRWDQYDCGYSTVC